MKKISFYIFAFLLTLSLSVSAQNNPGTPNPAFGDNGVVLFDVGSTFDECHDVLIQPDGAIVTIGAAQLFGDYRAFVSRHNPDGTLDQFFADHGYFIFEVSSCAAYGRGGYLNEDGQITFGVHCYNYNNGDCDAKVVRINLDGSIDASFGNNGVASFSDGGARTTLEDIQPVADGKTVFIGYQNDRVITGRFNADGTIDPTYGTNGSSKLEFESLIAGSYVKNSCVQPDGKIVMTGMADCENNSYVGIAIRIDEDGSVDETFGATEPGLSLINPGEAADFAMAPAMQNDKIVIAGHVWKGQNPALEYAVFVTRLNADGTTDTSFGRQGYIEAEYVEGYQNYAEGLAISHEGNISVIGHTYDGMSDCLIFVYNVTADGGINFNYGNTGMFGVCDNGRQNEAYDIKYEFGDYGDLVVCGFSSYADWTGRSIMLSKIYSDCETPSAVSEISDIDLVAWGANQSIMVENHSGNDLQMQVYNLLGQSVMNATIHEGSQQIAGLKNGLYIVRFSDQKGRESIAKVVVK